MRFGKDAEFGAGLFLAANIDLGRRVFADAHEREAGRHAALLQLRHALRQFAQDLRGDGAAVNDVVRLPWGFGR